MQKALNISLFLSRLFAFSSKKTDMNYHFFAIFWSEDATDVAMLTE